MKKLAFISVLFFLTIIQSYAFDIKGKIINLKGKPVRGAVVIHRITEKKSFSDEKGFFHLEIPDAEKVRLEIIHADYMTQEIVLTRQILKRKLIIKLIPYISQREEIVVTAMRYPESSARVPAAEKVISSQTMEEDMVPNITEALTKVPGVSTLGAGSFSLVPNIRGLARRRVLIMVDNARVTSDRRTGPNASFVNPRDIEKIEVLRSPSSVFYGSDAIGGVIHILTKKSLSNERFKGKFNIKYGMENQEKAIGLSIQGSRKNTGFYFSFQGNDAENYSSPLGEVPQSQYTQGSIFGKISHINNSREIHISFLGSRGFDIGKPNRDSLSNPTWYPKESQNLIQIHWHEKEIAGGELAFQAYVNPHFLETKKEKIDIFKTEESYSKTKSLDYGFHLSFGKKFGPSLRFNGGVDLFGRNSAQAKNSTTSFDRSGNIIDIIEEQPFTNGRRKDLGVFLSADYIGIKNLDLIAGFRWDRLLMEALPGNALSLEKRQQSTWTGFIGGSAKVFEEVVVFGNISRAYRVPSLSEMFYTGITGRGFIISQSDLKPETSLNLDAGLKIISKRFFAGFYSFYYVIDDLIERYRILERTYTYGNINKGRIKGYELEVEYFPITGWKIFGNFFSFTGKSATTKVYLNDIPPARILLGTRLWVGRFSAEINSTFQMKKKDAGPAEIKISSYRFINIKASHFINSSLRIYFVISNLFDETYLARPDPDSVEEPGRNFLFGLSYSF